MTERSLIYAALCLLASAWGATCTWGQQTPFGARPDPYAPAQPPANYNPPPAGPANYAPPPGPTYNSPAPSENYNPPAGPPANYGAAPAPGYDPGYPQVATAVPNSRPLPPLTRFEPAKIVAIVGDQYILAGDVLPIVEQVIEPYMEKVKSQAERDALEQQRPIIEAQLVKQLIDTKLMYLEFERAVPKDKLPEVQKKVRQSFEDELTKGREKVAPYIHDKKKLQEVVRRDPAVLRLAATMEENQLQSLGELDLELKKYGGSLEQQLRAYGEQRLGRSILSREINFEPEVTHDEMLRYYNEMREEYSFPAQARWEVVMVRKDRFPSRDAAFNALAAMGNEIFFGAPLGAVAKRSSQGYNADTGGQQDWTTQGALASKILDQAIFTLPENKLSQILEDEKGFYIVRVLERKEAGCTPFSEAQDELKEKIKTKKKEEQYRKFVDELRKKTPVWSIYEDDNNLNPNGQR